MGLDCSFLVVTPVRRVDALLEAIAAHLVPDDQARLRAALPWSPAVDRVSEWLGDPPARDRRGIAKLPREAGERGEDYCFTFLIPRDEVLTAYEQSGSPVSAEGGLVAVGCVWCDLRAGDEWAVFRATAATSDMSRLFERSPSVRALWSQVASKAQATALLFDTEDLEGWELLHPGSGRVTRPDEEPYELEDRLHLNIDGYFAEALQEAGVQPSHTLLTGPPGGSR